MLNFIGLLMALTAMVGWLHRGGLGWAAFSFAMALANGYFVRQEIAAEGGR